MRRITKKDSYSVVAIREGRSYCRGVYYWRGTAVEPLVAMGVIVGAVMLFAEGVALTVRWWHRRHPYR